MADKKPGKFSKERQFIKDKGGVWNYHQYYVINDIETRILICSNPSLNNLLASLKEGKYE